MEAGLPQITANGLTVFLLQRTSIEEAQAGKARLRLFLRSYWCPAAEKNVLTRQDNAMMPL